MRMFFFDINRICDNFCRRNCNKNLNKTKTIKFNKNFSCLYNKNLYREIVFIIDDECKICVYQMMSTMITFTLRWDCTDRSENNTRLIRAKERMKNDRYIKSIRALILTRVKDDIEAISKFYCKITWYFTQKIYDIITLSSLKILILRIRWIFSKCSNEYHVTIEFYYLNFLIQFIFLSSFLFL